MLETKLKDIRKYIWVEEICHGWAGILASKSAKIERMAMFPHWRAQLHLTTAAPGELCSLSTSTASRTPHKQNIRPDPLVKPSSSAVQSNESQW